MNVVVRARVDEEIKAEAMDVLSHIGLTMSDAIRLMMVKIAKEKCLPFAPFEPNDETIAAMNEAKEKKLKSFDNIESLMADLNAED